MTLRELAKITATAVEHTQDHDDDECVVVVKRGFAAVGGPHAVQVKSAGRGFDWTRGTFMIDADEPVYAGLEDMEAANKFASRVRDILFVRQRDTSRMRNGNALRLIGEALDEWLPDRYEK